MQRRQSILITLQADALFLVCLNSHWVLQMQTTASRTLSQAFSGGLPSPACAISISAAPAAVSQMDLAAAAGSITQSGASEGSAVAIPPAIAAQHAHLGSDADSHPMPSPNYRLDHVLADSLHSGMNASHDFGPMSLVSAMSNDENLTPAASSDFSRAARRAAHRQPDVTDAEDDAGQVSYSAAAYTLEDSF